MSQVAEKLGWSKARQVYTLQSSMCIWDGSVECLQSHYEKYTWGWMRLSQPKEQFLDSLGIKEKSPWRRTQTSLFKAISLSLIIVATFCLWRVMLNTLKRNTPKLKFLKFKGSRRKTGGKRTEPRSPKAELQATVFEEMRRIWDWLSDLVWKLRFNNFNVQKFKSPWNTWKTAGDITVYGHLGWNITEERLLETEWPWSEITWRTRCIQRMNSRISLILDHLKKNNGTLKIRNSQFTCFSQPVFFQWQS